MNISDSAPGSGGDAGPARPRLASRLTAVQAGVMVIAVILTGFCFWALRRIFEPFVLALFLLIMVDGLARFLSRRVPRLPAHAALPLAFLLIAGLFAGTVWLTADNASDFAAHSASYTARLNALLGDAAGRLGLQVTPTLATLMQRLNPGRFAGAFAQGLSRFAEGAVFVLIYLGFLVASRRGFEAKAAQLFATPQDQAEADRLIHRVRSGVESYLWVQTVIGLAITAASAALMGATGLSHIPFWCLIIFLANYIPAIGAAVGVLFPAVFGLVQFDGLARAAVLIAGLEAVHFTVSHVLQPRLQGRSLNLDPIVVLLALAFWGALWGVVGAILSTPLTVTAMAILAEFRGARPLAVLLSSDGRPYAEPQPPLDRPDGRKRPR